MRHVAELLAFIGATVFNATRGPGGRTMSYRDLMPGRRDPAPADPEAMAATMKQFVARHNAAIQRRKARAGKEP